jgi:flagellar motility protein MotE (MotC chaperone)
MSFLTSRWGLAILALLISAGTTVSLLLSALGSLAEPVIIAPEKTALPPQLWGFKTEAVNELIAELESERKKVEAEHKEATALRAQAASERGELEKVRAEIAAMNAEIDKRVVEIQERELKNLKTLAQTYSAMNPPEVVAIFREMDENNVVKLLSLMKADRVGAILGEMAKTADASGADSMAKRAARITDKLRLLKAATPAKA